MDLVENGVEVDCKLPSLLNPHESSLDLFKEIPCSVLFRVALRNVTGQNIKAFLNS